MAAFTSHDAEIQFLETVTKKKSYKRVSHEANFFLFFFLASDQEVGSQWVRAIGSIRSIQPTLALNCCPVFTFFNFFFPPSLEKLEDTQFNKKMIKNNNSNNNIILLCSLRA